MVLWKGIYFVLALFLGSFFGSIFMLGPLLPLMSISPAWYRWLTDRVVATWFTLPVVAAFIFIQRKWEEDKHHFGNMLDYFCDIHEPLQLLIFPEGTDLTDETKARSDTFAEKNGLQKYEYVLHPRTTGFTFIVDRLRDGNNLDAVHDITVAYPQNIPQTEKHLLCGNFPKEIHFHICRYSVESLPSSREDLQLWCQKRWEEKEKRLRQFYEGKKYFDVPGRSKIPPCKSELRVLVVKCISLLYWTFFTFSAIALLYMYSFVRWYFVIVVVIFTVQEKLFGGLELIELACHQFFNRRRLSSVSRC